MITIDVIIAVIAVIVVSYNHYFITSTVVIAVIVGSFNQYFITCDYQLSRL
jgi:hypothetical protein